MKVIVAACLAVLCAAESGPQAARELGKNKGPLCKPDDSQTVGDLESVGSSLSGKVEHLNEEVEKWTSEAAVWKDANKYGVGVRGDNSMPFCWCDWFCKEQAELQDEDVSRLAKAKAKQEAAMNSQEYKEALEAMERTNPTEAQKKLYELGQELSWEVGVHKWIIDNRSERLNKFCTNGRGLDCVGKTKAANLAVKLHNKQKTPLQQEVNRISHLTHGFSSEDGPASRETAAPPDHPVKFCSSFCNRQYELLLNSRKATERVQSRLDNKFAAEKYTTAVAALEEGVATNSQTNLANRANRAKAYLEIREEATRSLEKNLEELCGSDVHPTQR